MIAEEFLGSVSELDQVLSGDLPDRHGDELRVRLIREAVAHHFERNQRYARYCSRLGFAPSDLQEIDQLCTVPLLPTSVFKRDGLLTHTATEGNVVRTTSSGTQGMVSVVPRDDTTLMRFFASLTFGLRWLLDREGVTGLRLSLGPTPRDAPDLWMAYVMSGVGAFVDSDTFMAKRVLDLSRLVAVLRHAGSEQPVDIVGPPAALLELATVLAQEPVSLHPSSTVLTMGGWKRRADEAIPREGFDNRLAAALTLGVDRVRDVFNMVELNTVVFECAAKRKHVPPWLVAQARDPKTLESTTGDSGILAYLDPTPTSYPGFVLSDDFGWVDRNVSCPCGRVTDVLQVERRINSIESRGCARKLDDAEVQ